MSRFAKLNKDVETPKAPALTTPPPQERAGGKAAARNGKKGILGYFTPELSRELNMLAVKEDTTLQALMGEAFDLLLRSRGLHPYGER